MPNNKNILYRQISGALKSCIVAHGAIHKKIVSSATKRIIGQLSKFEVSYPDEALKEKLLYLMAAQYRNLTLLREKLKIARDDKKSHIAGKAAGIKNMLKVLNDILEKFDRYPNSIEEKELDQ